MIPIKTAFDLDDTLIWQPIPYRFQVLRKLFFLPRFDVRRRDVKYIVTGRWHKWRFFTRLTLILCGYWWVEEVRYNPKNQYDSEHLINTKINHLYYGEFSVYVDEKKLMCDNIRRAHTRKFHTYLNYIDLSCWTEFTEENYKRWLKS